MVVACRWEHVETSGQRPSARFGSQCAVVEGQPLIALFGGRDDERSYNDLFFLDLGLGFSSFLIISSEGRY